MAKITVENRQKQIAAKIAAILEKKGWNQQDLAIASKKSKSYISEVLSGDRNLTLKTIVIFENALNSDILGV
jgi:transcriptional regulator with XRE-family HTH domain